MTIIKNNAVIAGTVSQRLEALKKNMPAKTEISIEGVRHKASDIVAIYQASLDTRTALVTSRAQVKNDLAARQQAEENRLAIEPAVQAWVLGQFGSTSTVAHEFGYSPRRTGKKSAQTKADAVELAQATREARHTMGKKQKLEIKGTVPASPAPPPVPPANLAPPPPPGAARPNGAPAPSNGATTPSS